MSIASIVALALRSRLAREAARDRLKQWLQPPKPTARREPSVRGRASQIAGPMSFSGCKASADWAISHSPFIQDFHVP